MFPFCVFRLQIAVIAGVYDWRIVFSDDGKKVRMYA